MRIYVFAFFNFINPSVGIVISILVATLTFWLAYNAIVYTFEAKKQRTAIALVIILVLMVALNITAIKLTKQVQQTNELFGVQVFNR